MDEAGVGVRLEIDPRLAGKWIGKMIGRSLPMLVLVGCWTSAISSDQYDGESEKSLRRCCC